MPGRRKEPAIVIQMKGKTHYTKAEMKAREEAEIKVKPKRMVVPKELNDDQRTLFIQTYKQLEEYSMVTHLETNLLIRYVRAQYEYDNVTSQIEGINYKSVKEYSILMNLRLKISDELRKCEVDLGLNMFSRAKMAIPPKEEKKTSPTEALFGEI